MLKKKRNHLDDKTYMRSLNSGDSNHRFYDRLRSSNRKYAESRLSRILDKFEHKRRKRLHARMIKQIERRERKI